MTGAVVLALLCGAATGWVAAVHRSLTRDRRPSRRPLTADEHQWEQEMQP